MTTKLEEWKLLKEEKKKAYLKKCVMEKVLNLSNSKKCSSEIRLLMKDILLVLEGE